MLFELFYEYLISAGVKEDNIIKLEFDKRKYFVFRNPIALCDMIEKKLEDKDNERYFLLIDEVQMAKKAVIRGYKVDVGVVVDRRQGRNVQKEIDFVVNDLDRRVYIQSAYEMNKEEKTTSELDSFVLTGDFYKKIVIRNDISHHYYDENGFLHSSLLDFLMNRVELF